MTTPKTSTLSWSPPRAWQGPLAGARGAFALGRPGGEPAFGRPSFAIQE